MATYPTLPQASVDVSFSWPTGNEHNPNTSAELTTLLTGGALDGKVLALNDIITLDAGTTYTGLFTLPNFASGSGWIYVRSSGHASLPAVGSRVALADETNMAIISTPSDNDGIITADSAHHYRFVGVCFKHTVLYATSHRACAMISAYSSSTASDYPHHIVFDRCLFRGDTTTDSLRGVWMDGTDLAVVDSYLENFKVAGADSQAILIIQGDGPFLIHNNYIEAAGENSLCGGIDPSIADSVPQDITVTRNHYFKRLSWVNTSWTLKNLFELKNARRVLISGNTFENGWVEDQARSIVFTPRNQDGTASWSTVEDVTFRDNKVLNVDQCFSLLGQDDINTSQILSRLWVHNNLIVLGDTNSATHYAVLVINTTGEAGPNDLIVTHNTMLAPGVGGTVWWWENDLTGTSGDQLLIQDNLVYGGGNGFRSGIGEGTAVLDASYTNYIWTHNALIGAAGTYPANTWFPADAAAVAFVDYAGGNYRLSSGSDFYAGAANDASDGTDLGADIDAIELAISGITILRGSQFGGLG